MPDFATVHVNLLNLRQAPTTASAILRQMPYGTRLEVLDIPDDSGWIRVRLGQTLGFVAGAFIRLETPPETDTPDIPENAALAAYVARLPRYELPEGYHALWTQQTRLGLPDPFAVLPFELKDARLIEKQWVNGFGPNTFSLLYWTTWYKRVGGIHNGYDAIIKSGTPLLAVSDGVVLTNWRFMGNQADRTLALWCFLPEAYRDSQGRRMMSNVIVAYAHMSNNQMRRHLEVIHAGEVIGLSGTPMMSGTNAHLHFEVHLLQGDPHLPPLIAGSRPPLKEYQRSQPEGTVTPWNALLFFKESLTTYLLHQNATHGYAYNKLPGYPTEKMLRQNGLINYPPLDDFTLAYYRYSVPILWNKRDGSQWHPAMIKTEDLPERLGTFPRFEPYPASFLL